MKRRILSVLLAVAMMLTILPGMAFAAEDASSAPTDKPKVNANTELYQVEIMCEVDHAHYWTFPSTVGWSYSSPDQFEVGEPRLNDLDNGTAEQYPYICPVTSAYSLDECVAKVNAKNPGHWAVTTEEELPVAYYYWNAEEGWVLLRTKEANPQVRFAGTADDPKEGTLEIKISCAEQPGQPEQPEPDDSDKPTTKPAVGNAVLYQVEVLCQKHVDGDPDCKDHWWSHAETPAAFTVGDIQKNTTGYQQDAYKWVCPVTPSKALSSYLDSLNAKCAGHTMVSDKLPTAWFFWNGASWELIQEANTGVRFADNGVGSLTLYATCEGGGESDPGPGPVDPDPPAGDPVWLTSMSIMGYDLFTKAPDKLPDTADGKYLILATSHVEGDTDVYALYLNSTPCAPNNGVVTGQGVCAVKLGYDENGELAGYLGDAKEKIALSELLMTVEAVEGGYSISNGGKYLSIGSLMVGDSATALIIGTQDESGAYSITGGRPLTLYVNGKHTAGGATWKLTNFWGPGKAPGKSGSGSSYIYFLHTHVDDGRVVAAYDADGNEIPDVDGYLTIPAGGCIKVEDEVTFTVPNFVQNVELHKNYASNLVMNANGGFGVMGCTITMQDGTTTTSITRSGSAGSGVTFARTADNRLYFGGEGAMTDYSSHNTDVPVWLDSMGDRTLKSVFIGEGVTSVGSNAFKFTALSSVTLSEGLEMIGDGAFESCRISSIEIPGTVTDIGANAFKGCLDLRSIQLPESVISIGSNAFANCTRLRSVTFAGSLGSIPNGAFQAMSGYGQLNLVFLADAPASAYSDFEGMLPFLYQNGAIVYTQNAPGASLVASGGTDAYFAVLDGADLSGVELRSGVLPELPAKGGVAFTGWQVGDTTAALPAGTAVSGQPAGTVFTARWGGEYTVACTVTIDGVGYTVAQGKTMGSLMPADPTREGYRFAGWVDANGKPFTADTPIAGNMVITATWTEIPTYTVTLDPNGGVLAGRSSITLYEDEQLTLFQIPDIARGGYTFDGWFTEDGSRFLGAAITADMTLTARWTEEGAEPDVPDEPSQPNPPIGGGSTTVTPPAPAESDRPVEPSQPPEEIEDPDTPLAELPFVDVDKEAWYAESVAYVCAKGLMKGMSDMEFAPKATLTRGMMAQVMHNMAENPKSDVSSMFADLNGKYYTEAVAWGVANGVLKGYNETTFGGEDDLTREQMAVMLYRYAKAQGLGKDVDMSVLDGFADSARVSGWAKEAVAWAVENGLLKGRGNNDLDPRTNITRSEVAAVLERYSKLFLS